MADNGRRIAILGGGKIGESLLSGLLSSGWRKPEEIVVTGRRQERIDELAERYGVEATLSNADADAEDREAPERRRAGAARHAEHARHGARGRRRALRRGARKRRAPGDGRRGAHACRPRR